MHGGNLSKPKSPIFSLGAHGTIANTLTYQKRSGVDFVRRKPTPADPRSLPQMYHRWLYQDYILMWNVLTPTQKQVWNSLGSRHNRTGLSEFMRDKLSKKEDLAGVWHLDKATGAVAHDSSPNLNHGTIFGASPATGLIDGCRFFDGVDDRIVVPHSPSLNITGEITLFAMIYPTGWGPYPVQGYGRIFDKWSTGWLFYLNGQFKRLEFSIPGLLRRSLNNSIDLNQWWEVAITYDEANVHFYINGQLNRTLPGAIPIGTNTKDLMIGNSEETAWARTFDGLIDHAVIYNRILTLTQIQALSGRRYPL